MKEKTEKIWLRVGVTLEAPTEDIEKIRSGDTETLLSAFRGKNSRLIIDGETYIPCDAEENCVEGNIEFDFYHEIKMQFCDEAGKEKRNKKHNDGHER